MPEKSRGKAEYRSAVRSRRMIKKAFLELMHEKDPKKITVTDIVNRCGLNRGTFYAHYANVGAVLEQIENELIAAIEETLSPPNDEHERTLAFFLKRITGLLKSDVEFYRLVVTCDGGGFAEKFCDLVLEKQRRGELLSGANLNGRTGDAAARFIVGGFVSLYIDWFKGKTDCTLDELCEIVEELLSPALERFK